MHVCEGYLNGMSKWQARGSASWASHHDTHSAESVLHLIELGPSVTDDTALLLKTTPIQLIEHGELVPM